MASIEEVTAYKASDGTVYGTWLLAMRREAYLALKKAEVGNAFATVIEAGNNRSTAMALIAYAKVLEEIYGSNSD